MSLQERLLKAKDRLRSVDTKVITPDGRELLECTNAAGEKETKFVSIRPWGYVGDLKPDLQMAEIYPRVFLGSQDPASDIQLLTKHSITHIINIATGVEDFFPKQFNYLHLEVLDLPTEPILHYIDACNKFILDALKISPQTAVFIHCNAGISRSATICIAFLMKRKSFSLDEALLSVKTIRPSVRPNVGFLTQLREYEQTLKGCGRT